MRMKSDVREEHKLLVETHGELVYLLAMAMGLAGEATSQLGRVCEGHRSTKGMHALTVLVEQFNAVASALGEANNITREQIAECQRDILATPLDVSRIQRVH